MSASINNPTVLDLFAGSGGLSLGFQQAGYSIVGALEIDKWASDTYAQNFKDHKVFTTDITQLEDSFFTKFKGVDVIVGGPPCQGFSIAASNRRVSGDKRNSLYKEYVRAVSLVRPKAFLVENVKEIRSAKLADGSLLLDDFKARLEQLGYEVGFSLINAKYFGVPQDRIRFFMIGTLKEPFDFNTLALRANDSITAQHLLTISDAISDLPKFKDGQTIPEDSVLEYGSKPLNDYQKKLRTGSKAVFNHVPMRHTPRMIERFKHIEVGGDIKTLPEAHGARTRGDVNVLSKSLYHQNHRRLNPNTPSRTITASFYSSFIHPTQNRNLTVREAARIQGYPDWFIFTGKRTTLSKKLLTKKGIFEDLHLDQFNQVGNSVAPPLAYELAKALKPYVC